MKLPSTRRSFVGFVRECKRRVRRVGEIAGEIGRKFPRDPASPEVLGFNTRRNPITDTEMLL